MDKVDGTSGTRLTRLGGTRLIGLGGTRLMGLIEPTGFDGSHATEWVGAIFHL